MRDCRCNLAVYGRCGWHGKRRERGRPGRAPRRHPALLPAMLILLLRMTPSPEIALARVQELQAASDSTHADTTFALCIVGDLLLDRGVRTRIERRGPEHLFLGMQDVFRGMHAVIANLECPATEIRSALDKKYVFRAEPAWLHAARAAGITHVTLANNHSNDQGREGFVSTLGHLDAAGISRIGGGGTQDSACSPVLLGRGNTRIAVFSSTLVPLENWMYDSGKPGPCQASATELASRIQDWKLRNPSGYAVAVLHWGWEFRDRPNEEQGEHARRLIEAGADAVLGHHPHVVQTVEQYLGRPIVYSLGNFVFDQRAEAARDALAVVLRAGSGGLECALLPLRITRCVPAPAGVADAARIMRELRERSPRVVLAQSGAFWHLRPVRAVMDARDSDATTKPARANPSTMP